MLQLLLSVLVDIVSIYVVMARNPNDRREDWINKEGTRRVWQNWEKNWKENRRRKNGKLDGKSERMTNRLFLWYVYLRLLPRMHRVDSVKWYSPYKMLQMAAQVCGGQVLPTLWKPNVPTRIVNPEITYIMGSRMQPMLPTRKTAL